MTSIDELMEMRSNVTSGNWKVVVNNLNTEDFTYTRYFIENEAGEVISRDCLKSDAEYIVNACNSIPILIQKIKELEYGKKVYKWLLTHNETDLPCAFSIVEKTCLYPDICTCKTYPDDKSCRKECMIRCAKKSVVEEDISTDNFYNEE